MAYEANFVHGDPLMVDYTPSSAVVAGEVIPSGTRCLIVHSDTAADVLGAVAAGGGVYDVAKATGTGIATDVKVYWDNSNSVATATASGNTLLGVTVAAAASADEIVRVQHLAS